MLRRVARRWMGVDAAVKEGQKILGSDAFDVMGVRREFAVNMGDLKAKMKELQKVFHPDKVGGEKEDVRDLFLNVSAKCNSDYTLLCDDYTRACHIVYLETGNDINDETRAEELASLLDDDFLSEMMEFKMEILESEDDPPTLRRLSGENEDNYNSIFNEIHEHLEAGEYTQAETLLLKANYYRKIRSQIKELLPPE